MAAFRTWSQTAWRCCRLQISAATTLFQACTLEHGPIKTREIGSVLKGPAAESSETNCQNLSAELFLRLQKKPSLVHIVLPTSSCHCPTRCKTYGTCCPTFVRRDRLHLDTVTMSLICINGLRGGCSHRNMNSHSLFLISRSRVLFL